MLPTPTASLQEQRLSGALFSFAWPFEVGSQGENNRKGIQEESGEEENVVADFYAVVSVLIFMLVFSLTHLFDSTVLFVSPL